MKKTSTLCSSHAISSPLPASAPCSMAGAVEILDDACPGAAAEGEIRVETRGPVLFVDVDQVGRPREQRHGESARADRRCLGLRLVEAGDEALSASFRLHVHRDEVLLEERMRLGRSRRLEPPRCLVSFRERGEIDAERAGLVGFPENMLGRAPERVEGRRSCRRAASREARRTIPAETAGRAPRVEPPPACPISPRLRWRPTSSSDRASACRARTSRRP